MSVDATHKLVLHNDDENTCLYIMACLIKICNHERDQAEQCTIIAGNNDRCDIKLGDYLTLMDLSVQLDDLGVKTTIDNYEGCLY